MRYVPSGTINFLLPIAAVNAAETAALASCCTVAPDTVVAALFASTRDVPDPLATELTRNPLVAAAGGLAGTHDGRDRTIPLSVNVGETVSPRSEEHTSELQSRLHLVCRLLLEKKKKKIKKN